MFPIQLLSLPFCLLAAALPGSFRARGWRSHSVPSFPLFPSSFFFFSPKNNPSITGLVFRALGPGSTGNAKGGRIPKAGIITRGCCSLFGIVDFIKLGTGALQSLWIREGASFPLPAWIQLPGGWENAREHQKFHKFPVEGMGTGLWRWECGSTEPFPASRPHILAPPVLGALFHPENPAWSRGGREFVCLLPKPPE